MRYYSCDSHVVEAAEIYDGLVDRFGSRAPFIEKDHKGKAGTWVVLPDGLRPVPVGRLGIAGANLNDPATQERIEMGYDGFNPGVMDPSVRLDEQSQDGIVGEVMYPSLSMFTFAIPDDEVRAAAFRNHNDWVLDYCSVDQNRLIGIGCLSLPDVDAAIAEIDRSAERGVRGFAIPAHVDPAKPYNHPDFDPFWARAEEFGVPLTMHIFTGQTLEGGLAPHWGTPAGHLKGYTLAHTTAVNTMIDLICGGVVERFPRLKFVIAEYETGWVGHFKQRLDHAAYRTPWEVSDSLTMKPSEYFDRNFWVTFEDDAEGVATRHAIGVDNLVWGNDYPHHDSIWPRSQSILTDILSDVPAEEKEKMVWGNVVDLYDINTSMLPA
ncbi:MAG: amidohydrolase family protein [Actinomycetota bacterium]